MSGAAAGTEFWGYTASDLQTDIAVANGAVTGTLKYISTGALAADWGAGNFLAVKLTGIDEDATSVLIGLEPSEGTGLVEIIDDEDKVAVMRVADKAAQKLTIVTRCAGFAKVDRYDLSGLTLQTS